MTSVAQAPPLFQQFVFPNGPLLANGLLFAYVAGTTTKQTTYADSTGNVPNSNPIVLDATGACELWLDITKTYDLVLAYPNDTDPPTNPIRTVRNVGAPLTASALYPATPREIAVGAAVVNFQYPQGHVYRYGSNPNPGVTDMTATLNTWASVGGTLFIPVTDTLLISNVVNLISNSTITLAQGATIKSNTAGLSMFKAVLASNITIRGGTFQQTANNGTAHIGLIELNGCTNCLVDDVELVGAQWGGVLLAGTSNSTVRDCYIHNSLGSTLDNQDSHDISCYGSSSFNVICGNTCYGGTAVEHGIILLDPGGSIRPFKNTVYGNRVGPHKSYGIMNYLIDHADTFCTIENNEIEGITGTAQSGNAGAGIYNQGAGGTVIANNTIRNCCINTTSTTLTPAGIGLNMDSANAAVNVVGNTIVDMANYYGIEVVTGPANIVGNTIKFNSGVLANVGIYLNQASNVNVQGNTITIDTSISSGHGIFAYASGVNVVNLAISNNVIAGTSGFGIRVDQTGGKTSTGVVVNGNQVSGGSSASIPIGLYSVVLGAVSGNMASATTVQALDISTCTQTRVTGNAFTTTGTLAINFAGTCTGSYYDKSNGQNTSPKNAATGLIVEVLGTATPASGFNSAVGDRVEQSNPVVGNPKGWRCTVSGNPGTWVSEGNL